MCPGINSVGLQSQYLRNAYETQAGLSGDSSLMGLNPLCTFGEPNNIFGNYGGMYPGMYGMGMGMGCGMYPGMYGMGMGYGPGSEVMNMSQADLIKYQEQLENYQIEKKVNQHRRMEGAEFSITAPQNKIAAQAGVLQNAIRNNNQDNIQAAFNNLKEAVKEKLCETGRSDDEILNNLNSETIKAYTEATGENLRDSLQTHGDSEFVQGLKQGAGFGLGTFLTNTNNYKDNLANITGEQVTTSDKAQKWVGVGVAGALTGLALMLICKKGGNVTHLFQKGLTSYRLNRLASATSKVEGAATVLKTDAAEEAAVKAKEAFENAQMAATTKEANYQTRKANKIIGKLGYSF